MKSVLTTHVGSLPFMDIEKALEYTFAFDIPVLFSLPKLDSAQFMLEEAKSILKEGSSNIRPPSNLNKFLLEKEKRQLTRFKYQLAGPWTLYHSEQPKVSFKQFSESLIPKYSLLINELSKEGELFFALDEPLLAKATQSQLTELNHFIGEIASIANVRLILHSCAKLPLEAINSLEVEFINLDLSLYSREELASMQQLNAPGLKAGKLGPIIEKELLTRIVDTMLLTPACGLTFHDIYYVKEMLTSLKQVQKILVAVNS